MHNNPIYQAELQIFENVPFKRKQRCGHVFSRSWRLVETAKAHPDYKSLLLAKKWLIISLSFWAIPCDGLVGHICKRIEKGERLSERVIFMLELMEESVPGEEEQRMIAQLERIIETGGYDQFVPGSPKFHAMQHEASVDPILKKRWDRANQLFNLDLLRDENGLVRRTPAQERNYSNRKWNSEDEKVMAQMAVDLFCTRYMLFAMAGDYPLVQKLSINPTPVGWIMFWPRLWNIDGPRDFGWRLIAPYLRVRGTKKQGPKMSMERYEANMQCAAAELAWEEAGPLGLSGVERLEHTIQKAQLPPDIDEGTLRRMRRTGRRLLAEGKIAVEHFQMTPKSEVKRETPSTPPASANITSPLDLDPTQARAGIAKWSHEEQCKLMKWIQDQQMKA